MVMSLRWVNSTLAWTSRNCSENAESIDVLRTAVWLNKILLHHLGKPVAIVVCCLPLAWLVLSLLAGQLGANPAERLVRSTGDWTLRFLCLTLAITPLRQWTNWNALVRYRRILGLATYGYVLLHLLAYGWFDMGLELVEISIDIGKRPFILVGFSAFLLLTPLALTSMNAAVRWLGAKRWQQLHRLVYAVAVLAMLHFFWMRSAKRNFGEVIFYGVIVFSLLGWRVWKLRQRRFGLARSGGEKVS